MTDYQVKNLETEHLSTNLREQINYELQSKLGLQLSNQMNTKISWCALICCWVELFQNAQNTFYNHLNNLDQQKSKHYATFQSIINGNQNEITV